ncbi:MAG: haloacid dehalogenase-like hydrolase [Proteobacteria bacterium]|nr:haloacid dehalogenase-like hydrolase [Pseudomonadota bacterium]
MLHPTQQPFSESVIAVIWDFDKTLIKGSMQTSIFEHYGVAESDFWRETNNLPAFYAKQGHQRMLGDTLYLNHMLTYVQKGIFKGLNNKMLRGFGAKIDEMPGYFPGVHEIFDHLKNVAADHAAQKGFEVKLEHYIISTGLQEMLEGSSVRKYFKDVWGCTFIEHPAQPGYETAKGAAVDDGQISQLGYVIDNTSKTRCIFEINKGSNVHAQINVNSFVPQDSRRVPFENMIYVADGISDIPVFSLVKQYGGRTLAVYDPSSKRAFDQAEMMLEDGRVHHFCPADYTDGSQARMWLTKRVTNMVERIITAKKHHIATTVSQPMGHPLSGKED